MCFITIFLLTVLLPKVFNFFVDLTEKIRRKRLKKIIAEIEPDLKIIVDKQFLARIGSLNLALDTINYRHKNSDNTYNNTCDSQ